MGAMIAGHGSTACMRIRFTKLSDRRHKLEVERAGQKESVELESRSTLFHDFTHLAVEEAAAIDNGFFGSLARGGTLAELAARAGDGPIAYADSSLRVECAVAVLQQLAKRDEDPAAFHARITEALAIQEESLPSWFTIEFVAAVRDRLRTLVGRWKATPYGAEMEVSWMRDANEP